MVTVARQVGMAFGSFVVAWLAATLVARWLSGSSNIVALVIGLVGVIVYVAMLRRDRRAG